jgi:hypothetical protein
MRKILLSVFFWSLSCFGKPTWTPDKYHKRTAFLAELNKVLLPSKDLKDLIQVYRGIYDLHLKACPDEQLELLPLFEKVSNSKWKFRGVIKEKPLRSYLVQYTRRGYLRDKPFSDYITVKIVAEQDIEIVAEQDASFIYAEKIPQAPQSSRSERAKRKKMGEREKREQLREKREQLQEQMADY